MKTIVLCRHAKADYPDGVRDFDRPLKEKGIKDAHEMGKLLAEKSFLPDLILSSPALRAISTAEIIAKAIGYPLSAISLNPCIYEEQVGDLIEMIEEISPEIKTVMIFGHNPTLSAGVNALLSMYHPFEMPTSGMVCIESPFNSWDFTHPQSGRLRWMLVPRLKGKT